MASIARHGLQAGLQVKRARKPDELRAFRAHGHVEVHKLGQTSVMRAVFEPGWKWSTDVGPIAGTKSCEASHLCFVVSGILRIRMDDGTEAEVRPGDFFKVEPGHDAWVVGEEACVLVDFADQEHYARAPTPHRDSQHDSQYDRPTAS